LERFTWEGPGKGQKNLLPGTFLVSLIKNRKKPLFNLTRVKPSKNVRGGGLYEREGVVKEGKKKKRKGLVLEIRKPLSH